MGNCFGTQVNHHHSPGSSTKTTTPAETSRNNSKQTEGPLRSKSNADQKGSVEERPQPQAGKVITPNLKLFKLAELKSATRNFRPDTVLGEGGFGRVFKGWVDETTYAPSKVGAGVAVAVKKSNPDSPQGLEEWLAEVKFLGKFSHPNLVKLLGYCWEDKEYLLVYEYMQKGSLENHLFRKGSPEPLPWNTRLKIAIGAARGLSFLHTSEKSVIYRDFKPANILLDGNYNAKLSDFGLAKLGPINGNSHVTTRVMGTYGYAAPEYVETGHLYVKSDVYGFGVVLLEMITGLRAHDPNRTSDSQNLVLYAKPSLSNKKKLKKIMDSRLGELYPLEGACQAAQLILRCLESDPKNRPSMENVLEELENINAIAMTTKETKASAKQGSNVRQEEQTKHQHRYNHRRPPTPQKNGFSGAGARAYHH
ncbi:probable serine/threonine-protein kinase PIX13 isoform X1 [Corylus avellana]|uniref:probable serine/threonine-protein kinase PIX13 isoform X1 n=1 Tax=Corylus avellana TaxID=13451 RepID=UPI00286B7BB9|nr:probable serine/threonine-protein kinase PIX13 isoform X1 [Corylus avellana]